MDAQMTIEEVIAVKELADRIETVLQNVDVFASDTPNLNAWPQPNARRPFAEWLAARIV